MLIEKGLGAGVLLDNYAQISNSKIVALDNITSEIFNERVIVIVSKHIPNIAKMIKFLREQVDSYVKTIIGK